MLGMARPDLRIRWSWRARLVIWCSRFVALAALLVPLSVLLTTVGPLIHLPVFSLSSPSSGSSRPVPLVARSASSVVGGPSISAVIIDRVLAAAGSPASGLGWSLYELSTQYGVDDAYALAVFEHESSYGLAGAGAVNHSLGNIICAGYPTCNGRFRSYRSWQEGFEDFYRLIAHEYVAHGLTTIDQIVPVYAPASDRNDVAGYEASLRHAIALFRLGQLA